MKKVVYSYWVILAVRFEICYYMLEVWLGVFKFKRVFKYFFDFFVYGWELLLLI